MIVGIFSDTHDNLPLIRRALARFREEGAQAVLHAGDIVAPFAMKEIVKWEGPLFIVYGNNDGERKGLADIKPEIEAGPLRFELGGRKFALVHEPEKFTDADRGSCDVLVSGHTHDPVIETGKPLFINPGECGGWLRGRSTIALLDTDTMEARIIRLDEEVESRKSKV